MYVNCKENWSYRLTKGEREFIHILSPYIDNDCVLNNKDGERPVIEDIVEITGYDRKKVKRLFYGISRKGLLFRAMSGNVITQKLHMVYMFHPYILPECDNADLDGHVANYFQHMWDMIDEQYDNTMLLK